MGWEKSKHDRGLNGDIVREKYFWGFVRSLDFVLQYPRSAAFVGRWREQVAFGLGEWN